MNSTTIKRLSVLLLVLTIFSFTGLPARDVYLFSYFVGQSDGLHLAYSYDGLHWTVLNDGRSMLTPTVGNDRLMRDPSIVQGPDGTFHMVWTSSWNDQIIGYASSRDLIHWSEQRAIPVMKHEPEALNAWAPELFYDEPSHTYYIYWATTIPDRHKPVASTEREKQWNHRIYYCTTQDFQTFSETKLFFDPDFNVIDAAIVRQPKSGRLLMVVKNENSLPAEKNLRVTTTKNIAKGFPTKVSAPISPKDIWCEGPAPLYVGDTLYVYFDMYRNHRYGVVRSLDDGKTWQDVSDQLHIPQGIRHGTAFRVDEAVLKPLLNLHEYNPLIPDHIADGSVAKFGDTYYMYATTDLDKGLEQCGAPVVWQSKDFVNWSFEGSHIQGFDWHQPFPYTDKKGQQRNGYWRYWAPGKVVEKDGKYLLYVTLVSPDEAKMPTYILEADHPAGPFRFDSTAVVCPDIDGEPFIDDDGKGYIFWRRRHAAQLSDDWRSTEGDAVSIPTKQGGYSEGPICFKRKGIYYYLYTLSGRENYHYAYMMSKESPLSGYQAPAQGDIFLVSAPGNNVWGPGHGNVFYDEASDRYAMLYLEYGDGGTTRQMYANWLDFNEDGTIRQLVPDRYGIGYLAAPQESRPNLALQAKFKASSERKDRQVKTVYRTRSYKAASAGDGSNGTYWQAAEEDNNPTLTMDLGKVQQVAETCFYPLHPTEGHRWHIDYSIDGQNWTPCGQQTERVARSPHRVSINKEIRYLRLTIDEGAPGVWEWQALSAVGQPRYRMESINREQLNRGVVAVRDSGHVVISWRTLTSDKKGEPFDIYRNGKKLNTEKLTSSGTFFIDESPIINENVVYEVRGGGKDGTYTLLADAPVGYLPIKLQKPDGGTTPDGRSFNYTANDASVADVDGDGQYEIILKWDPTNAHDNAHDGYTGPTLFDCYRLDGTLLWRIDMGINIRSGAHYVPFIVYDLDGDGKAEFIVRTADGTRDSKGNVIGDAQADYRHRASKDSPAPSPQQEWGKYNQKGRPMTGRILSGPDYITVFNGLTGEAMDTKPYVPQRGNPKDWGDAYANRSDRMLAAVGYLDGQRASAIFCRGYYTRSVIAAWDWDGKELKQHWVFDTNELEWRSYAGQGNHNIRVADVDGDGCDEITYGSMAIDHDGTGLYNTGFGHGDAIHLTAFDPMSNRLQVWDCHENKRDGSDFRDAATGKVIFQIPSKSDVGRAMAADIDPTNPGVEMWSSDSHGIRNIKGEVINAVQDAEDPQHQQHLRLRGRRLSINFGIWWDGDLLRELLDRETITKYDWENHEVKTIARLPGVVFNNGSKSNPCLSADIIGDWREEIIARTPESDELRIFVSPIPTDYRINCLMEDIPYRLSTAAQNVGYNQPSETGFYLGPDKTVNPFLK